MMDAQDGEYRLDSSGGAEHVPGHRFGRTDRQPRRVILEHCLDRLGLTAIIEGVEVPWALM